VSAPGRMLEALGAENSNRIATVLALVIVSCKLFVIV